MSILQKILQEKREEVARAQQIAHFDEIRGQAARQGPAQPFAAALRNAAVPAVIAEIKRASPSRGPIRPDLEPVSVARSFTDAGAACLSILTDEKFFSGQLSFLKEIRRVVSGIPLLRKDFIIDRYQVWESRAAGADAILLILAALDDDSLAALAFESADAGLETLLEIHNEKELGRAMLLLKAFEARYAGARALPVLGINNRNLDTFHVSLDTFEQLSKKSSAALPVHGLRREQLVLAAESGMFTGDDVSRMRRAGADAFLIGEFLVASGDPGENLRKLIQHTKALLR